MVEQHKLTGIDNKGLLKAIEPLRREWPDAHLEVAKTARSLPRLRGGRASRRPWTSPKILLDLKSKAVDGLLAAIRELLPEGRYEAVAWANVLERDDYIESHDHRWARAAVENTVSALYYAQAEGGDIVFEDGTEVAALTGLCLIFPADLAHQVPLYDGAAERVSIAFNFRRLEM